MSKDPPDDARPDPFDIDPEQRLLLAYRLVLTPPAQDGSKLITVANVGSYEVRLIELAGSRSWDVPAIWVELFDGHTQRSSDRTGCQSLSDALVIVQVLTQEAKRRSAEGPQD